MAAKSPSVHARLGIKLAITLKTNERYRCLQRHLTA